MEENKIVIYQTEDGQTQIDVRLENDTVWLTQAQMAELFERTPQNITMHIRNAYNEGELERESTCKEYLQVQIEGKRKVKRSQKYYDLDVIISVGYRVKSKRGTDFRIWARKVLKQYLVKGYAIKRLEVKNCIPVWRKRQLCYFISSPRIIRLVMATSVLLPHYSYGSLITMESSIALMVRNVWQITLSLPLL